MVGIFVEQNSNKFGVLAFSDQSILILISSSVIILPTYVSKYIVNVWKIFLDHLSRFDNAVSNVTVCTYR